MKILFTGRHSEITKKFNHYVRKRLGKLSIFLRPEATVHVTLVVENYRHTVEVLTKDGPYEATARQTTKDMYQSVDLLVEKLSRQLARKHEKRARKTSSGRLALRPEEPIASTAPRIEVETWSGKPMTTEEAALQLLSQRRPFLVFEEDESGQLAVLLKQPDGSLRLIVKE